MGPGCPQGVPKCPRCPQGQDVRRELLAQVQALPSLLSRVGDSASALGDAIELYQACVAFVCDRWGQPWHPKTALTPQNIPQILKQPSLPQNNPLGPPKPWYLGMLRCP